MKKVFGGIIAALVALTMVSSVSASDVPPEYAHLIVNGLTVKVDNKPIVFTDSEPYYDLRNYRVMVPVRFVSEALGAKVDWDVNTKTVKMTRQNSTITLKIGSNKALVNGETFTFNAPAIIRESRTYVPIRFVSETFGAKVDWSEKDRTVSITNGQVQPVKDAVGANIPVNSNNPYFLSFHKSLKIRNGVISGVVPKSQNGDVLVSLDVWFKDGTTEVFHDGGNFSYRVRDVHNMGFSVFDRNGKGRYIVIFAYELPSLMPINLTNKK